MRKHLSLLLLLLLAVLMAAAFAFAEDAEDPVLAHTADDSIVLRKSNLQGDYDETLAYVRDLNAAGVSAKADVYRGNIHGFDALFWTKQAREARRKLCEHYEAFFK